MKSDNLHYFYDTEADILYFSKGNPSPNVMTQEMKDDVVARLDPKTGQVVGFTVLNFLKRSQHSATSVPLPFQLELTPAR